MIKYEGKKPILGTAAATGKALRDEEGAERSAEGLISIAADAPQLVHTQLEALEATPMARFASRCNWIFY